MANFIAFDLIGPLSPQDNAYDLMKLFPNGDRVFEVLSRYDDLLTLEEKEGYEPGDTLALIVPFLVLHNITEENITTLLAYRHYAKVGLSTETLVQLNLPLAIKESLFQSSVVQISQIHRFLNLINIIIGNKYKRHLGLYQLYIPRSLGIGRRL